MYTIIGGDGKEYGPVTADQIRSWIAAGRANLDTRVKVLGTDHWVRLGEVSEFTTDGGGDVPPPVAEIDGASPDAIADALLARHARLDIGRCYERSWILLKANFWSLTGATIAVWVVEFAISMATGPRIPVVALLSGVFSGGLYLFLLRTIRGQPVEITTAFAGFGRAFIPLFLATILSVVLIVLGLCVVILPGIYLAVAYVFTYFLIIDRGFGIWKAMEVSRRVVTAQWWRVLGMLLLTIPFLVLGLALLLVGFFPALAFVLGAISYAYEDLFKRS